MLYFYSHVGKLVYIKSKHIIFGLFGADSLHIGHNIMATSLLEVLSVVLFVFLVILSLALAISLACRLTLNEVLLFNFRNSSIDNVTLSESLIISFFRSPSHATLVILLMHFLMMLTKFNLLVLSFYKGIVDFIFLSSLVQTFFLVFFHS